MSPIQEHPKIPKYWKLAERLREQIQQGHLQPGDRIPSRVQVQTEYGVSPGTAEKVFAELEKEGLIVREQGRGTFVAEARRRATTGLIGFVGAAYAGRKKYHANAQITDGIEEVMVHGEKRIVLLDGNSPAGWDKVDGILVDVPFDADSALRHLPPGMPCVSLHVDVQGVASVIADDFGGARQAVEHLVGLGHRRIACLMEAQPPLARLRRQGYLAAMKAAGIEPEASWMRESSILFSGDIGYRRWAHDNMTGSLGLRWREDGCTAILAQNDMVAIGIIEALREAGVRVPEDMSVVGFDSTEICDCVQPTVTAVKVPLHEIGAEGARVLLKQIEQGQNIAEKVVLPTHVDTRNSTAAPEPVTAVKTSPRAGQKKEGAFSYTPQSSLLSLIEGVR